MHKLKGQKKCTLNIIHNHDVPDEELKDSFYVGDVSKKYLRTYWYDKEKKTYWFIDCLAWRLENRYGPNYIQMFTSFYISLYVFVDVFQNKGELIFEQCKIINNFSLVGVNTFWQWSKPVLRHVFASLFCLLECLD